MRRLLPFALAGLLALTLLPGMAAIEAIDWREARDTVVTLQSTLGKDWTTAVYAGEPFFEKPLPGYAHELLALRLVHRVAWTAPLGLSDVAASRAVRAAIAVLLAIVVAVIGTRAFGWRAGGLAACALASSVGLPLATRTDGTQLMATLCSWVGVGGLLALVRGRPERAGVARFGAWLALGGALLVGGPLSALWPLLGFALYFALARVRGGWREVRPAWGALIPIGMALPWYGMMTALHGMPFLACVPWFPYAAETRGAWFAGPLIALSYALVLGFPWTPLLAASLSDATVRMRAARAARTDLPPDLRDPQRASSLLLLLMFAAGIPVAFYPGPPLTAALPTLPALALLCGRFIDRVLDGDVETRHLTAATRLCAFLGTSAALLTLALASVLPPAAGALRLTGTVLFIGSWAPLLADLLGRRKLAAALFAVPVALGAPLVETRVLPAMEPWLNTRQVAEAVEGAAPQRAPLVMFEPPPPSLRLLLKRNFVLATGPATALAAEPALAGRDGFVYLAFRPAREREVAREAATPIEVLLRTPTLTLARVRPRAR